MRTYYLLSLRERERKKLLGVLNEKLSADATQKDYIDDFLDSDVDGIVYCFDSCPNDFENDSDGDGVCGDVDVCPGFYDNLDTDLD